MTQPLLSIGQARVSVGNLGLFIIAVGLVVVVARAARSLIGSRLLARTGMDRGLQYAIERMVYYALLVLGLMVALQTSGIEVSSVTVILGALGVGIGFGLQNIVNNFVSGLILLVERPVQVGDWIEAGGGSDRRPRRTHRRPQHDDPDQRQHHHDHPERGSGHPPDHQLEPRRPSGALPDAGGGWPTAATWPACAQALLAVAAAHPSVLRDPPPTVFFHGFGESALNLELVVWTREMVQAPLQFRSDLNFAIEAAFRRHGIQIPFPQRDLHLMSGTGSVAPPPHREPGMAGEGNG